MPFLDEIDNLCEGQKLEFKEAVAVLPDDIWETYSAFANTEGGEIVLGVRENADKTYTIVGVAEPGGLIDQFWTTLRSTDKVERDILFHDSVRKERVNGVDVVIIDVPRAERGDKPVRVKSKRDKRFGAWIRRGSTDISIVARMVGQGYRV